MKTIIIEVPNWIPTLRDLHKYKHTVSKWIFPPRCVDCNKRLKSSTFEWRQHRTGTHPAGTKNVECDFGINISRPYCVNCAREFLHNLPYDVGNCTICETKNVQVMGYRYIKEPKTFITFLWGWWNGSTFCVKCVDELLSKGVPTT